MEPLLGHTFVLVKRNPLGEKREFGAEPLDDERFRLSDSQALWVRVGAVPPRRKERQAALPTATNVRSYISSQDDSLLATFRIFVVYFGQSKRVSVVIS